MYVKTNFKLVINSMQTEHILKPQINDKIYCKIK